MIDVEPTERLQIAPEVARRLGYYVYLSVDPRNEQPFYVGKGQGDRALLHVSEKTSGAAGLFQPIDSSDSAFGVTEQTLRARWTRSDRLTVTSGGRAVMVRPPNAVREIL